MVQEPPGAPKVQDDADVIGAADDKASKLYLGIGATVVACLCSSFASVYLEKILTESKPSIWVRNAQLCIFAQACAIIVGGFGSWLFFDFKITTRFVSGVSLVIGSIFIYGSSLEQLTEWKTAAAKALGL